MLMPAVLLAMSLAAEAPKAAPAATPASPVPAVGEKPNVVLEPIEHHRLVLGGTPGRFNEWARSDIDFFAFQTVVRVNEVHGKPADSWASVARVNLLGAGDEKTRKVLALVLQFDRETRKPLPYYTLSGSDATHGFKLEMPADKPIRLSAFAARAGKLLVTINDARFEIDLPFEIRGVSVVASGLDAVFEPFELMRKAPH